MVMARLMAMVLVALTVVFVCLWFYARAARIIPAEAPGRHDLVWLQPGLVL